MKKSKFMYMVPTILICLMLSLFPLFRYLTDIKKITSSYMGIFGIAYLLILILLILYSVFQLCSLIRFVVNSDMNLGKKILWIFLLITFNILIIPYFYSKYVNQDKKIIIKALIYLVPIILFSIFAFCTMDKYNSEKKRIEDEKKAIEAERYYFTTKDGLVTFTFRHNYIQSEVGSYDLYVKNDEKKVVFTAFTYETERFEEKTSDDFLNKGINDISLGKEVFNLVKDKEVLSFGDKTISTIIFEGKTTTTDLCIYRISTIEFVNKPNYIVYTVEISTKGNYVKNLSIMDEILSSAKLN